MEKEFKQNIYQQSGLQITVINEEKFVEVLFKGDFDSTSLKERRDELNSILKTKEQKSILLNFSDVNFVNSESISFLFDFFARGNDLGKVVYMVSAKDNVKDVLSVIGAFDVIKYLDSKQEYLRKIINV